MTKPLYDVIARTKSKINWKFEEKRVFENVKNIWSSNLENNMPDMEKKFILETDA